jgi:hypothetical protein
MSLDQLLSLVRVGWNARGATTGDVAVTSQVAQTGLARSLSTEMQRAQATSIVRIFRTEEELQSMLRCLSEATGESQALHL